jgi:hypothetical protein
MSFMLDDWVQQFFSTVADGKNQPWIILRASSQTSKFFFMKFEEFSAVFSLQNGKRNDTLE